MPVVPSRRDFDTRSGNWLERLVFNHRLWVMLACALVSLWLGAEATKLQVNASFEKMIPQSHPYIRNYLDNRKDLAGISNAVRVVVEHTEGEIYDAAYLATLAQINDALFLLPGTERAWMKSLWTPVVRWTEVTEEGLQGGPVMPDVSSAQKLSPEQLAQLRLNVGRAGIVGSLVGNDQRSSMIIVPLMDRLEDGRPLDYGAYARALDSVRERFESRSIRIRINGFAKLAGDLIQGLSQVMGFFAAAAAIAALIIGLHTRCWRSTLLLVASSLLGVLWLLGLMHIFGFVLDPYSILVPFLIFSIGLSHGAQKMNGIMQDIGRGTHKYVAARYTFRRLFLAGLTALLTNVVGFGVLMIIDIPVIRELALTTSLGVCILIFTKLLLVPVLLSYLGVSPAAARRSVREDTVETRGSGIGRLWNGLGRFTEPQAARAAVIVAALLGTGALAISLNLQVGDLDAGAPELRPDSRYNRDNGYVTAHYGLSSDLFAVIVKTPPGGCDKAAVLLESDRLGWALRQDPAVQDVISLPEVVRRYTAGGFEGAPKWMTLPRNQTLVNQGVRPALLNNPELSNQGCAITPVIAYLADHKAETLQRVLGIAERFAAQHDSAGLQFLPAAGSAGIEAVTNIVVRQANRTMLVLLYGAVALLCFITFRSWRAVVVALVPLLITSVMCEALMVLLGIGVKVATLPVIALGVGVGVDYALYLLSVQLAQQRAGVPLGLAYRRALQFTGKVVALVGLTLAAGVITWAWSPIKFQADMGILLVFMFLWNMAGALVLIPALSHFLLRGQPAGTTDSRHDKLPGTTPALNPPILEKSAC
ncbi:efflux RND transporter permease subunit [Aquabacterium sp.]|uniref:efflux RND transporter permease subunit n=1 Tax=Aquabacterium sp. TaxID=1872578 RepID=UPI002C76062A|nr:MMPL family transporter [Aquabacterium sp.]HSW03557.1 MMPL family transporter [Aquabacterium sp.]